MPQVWHAEPSLLVMEHIEADGAGSAEEHAADLLAALRDQPLDHGAFTQPRLHHLLQGRFQQARRFGLQLDQIVFDRLQHTGPTQHIDGTGAGGILHHALDAAVDLEQPAHQVLIEREFRLTDGRGDTAYFSETILVFTSNLGIYVDDERGGRMQNVRPGDTYETVEAKVREAIGNYFKFKLSRPELLNRIGDNIVVFDFISREVAERIFDGMLSNVARRLFEEFKVRLGMPAAVRQALLDRCTRDLSNGGRGIGNQLESCFINPLSRALFELDIEGKQSLAVTGMSETDKVVSLSVQAA